MKKKKNGRPLKLTDGDKEKILKFAKFGLTDEQLAAGAGITPKTLANYKNRDPKFLQSLKESKDLADNMVRKSLFKLATGFEYYEDMVNKDGSVRCLKVSRPDATACIFWLKNRQPQEWKDRHEHDLGKGTADTLTGIAKILARGSKEEDARLAAGEDPSVVYLGRAVGRPQNGRVSSLN